MSKIKFLFSILIAWVLAFLHGERGQLNLGMLGGLGSLLGGLGGGTTKQAAKSNVFKKILAHGDWIPAADVLCPADVWTVIGSFTVPAQQAYRFGYGSPAFPDNQGYIYVALYDDTATNSVLEDGALRLVQRNAQGTISLVVAEFRTEQLRGSTTDRQQMIALPEQTQFPLVGEDSVLELQFRADAADTVVILAIGTAAGLDIWNVPVTVYQ